MCIFLLNFILWLSDVEYKQSESDDKILPLLNLLFLTKSTDVSASAVDDTKNSERENGDISNQRESRESRTSCNDRKNSDVLHQSEHLRVRCDLQISETNLDFTEE